MKNAILKMALMIATAVFPCFTYQVVLVDTGVLTQDEAIMLLICFSLGSQMVDAATAKREEG